MGLILVRFLPAHDKPIMTLSIEDKLGDDHRGTYGSQLMWVKLMTTSCLTMIIGLYLFWTFVLFCSFVHPIHLVCLCHLDHRVSMVLAVTTTPL
jgi:hypothetical protein